MATIAIMIDLESGHIIPTFWLSRHLIACGHRVCYLGLPDAERIVRQQGFEFISITPKGYQYDIQTHLAREDVNAYFVHLVRGELLDRAFTELRPNVMLLISNYYIWGLAVRYRYRIPIVFYTPIFPHRTRSIENESIIYDLMTLKSGAAEFLELLTDSGEAIENFKDVAQLALRYPEIALIPEAFDLPGMDKDPNIYYVGSGIDIARNEPTLPLDNIDSNRPLIYCARGSQLQMNLEENRRSFQTTIDAATLRPEWQFIIAIGEIFKAEDFSGVPPNVTLFNWVPQLEVLSRSNVMINHGGFGTIKECIHMGVPMVVLPVKGFRDHSGCAQRVVHHGLGVQNDDPQISPGELILLIEQVINDPPFKRNVGQMGEKINQQDRSDLAVKIIERVMTDFRL